MDLNKEYREIGYGPFNEDDIWRMRNMIERAVSASDFTGGERGKLGLPDTSVTLDPSQAHLFPALIGETLRYKTVDGGFYWKFADRVEHSPGLGMTPDVDGNVSFGELVQSVIEHELDHCDAARCEGVPIVGYGVRIRQRDDGHYASFYSEQIGTPSQHARILLAPRHPGTEDRLNVLIHGNLRQKMQALRR